TLGHFFKESVLGAGILEQVVGEVHKNVLKTMLCSYFTKNNRLSLYLLPIKRLNSVWRLRCRSGSRCAYVRLCTPRPSASLGS
ncbi:MAG: hypothetical protein LW809_02430, partial [Vampirovibrionales bacterium]|nr:hypothetical protein [Vampirovibrionales bacterium]